MASDRFRELIEEELVVERDGWARERADRVTARLQAGVPEAERFETLVIWGAIHNAFTGPGRTVYFTRRLFERMPDDDAAAFVIAHELAHHRLGHVPAMARAWFALPLHLLLRLLERRIANAERERDADLLAIEMCLDAGYDAARCLVAFEILAQIKLDYRDVDGVLGAEDPGAPPRSHDAVQIRLAAARIHVDAVRRGRRVSLDVTRDRERRRRKVMLATVGGAALTVALVLLRRRP